MLNFVMERLEIVKSKFNNGRLVDIVILDGRAFWTALGKKV